MPRVKATEAIIWDVSRIAISVASLPVAQQLESVIRFYSLENDLVFEDKTIFQVQCRQWFINLFIFPHSFDQED